MKQDDPQFKLRLKPELKEKFEESARANNRALGAEIVAALEEVQSLRVRVAALADELAKLRLSSDATEKRYLDREAAYSRAAENQELVTKMLAHLILSTAESANPKPETIGMHKLMQYLATEVNEGSAETASTAIKDLTVAALRALKEGAGDPNVVYELRLPSPVGGHVKKSQNRAEAEAIVDSFTKKATAKRRP